MASSNRVLTLCVVPYVMRVASCCWVALLSRAGAGDACWGVGQGGGLGVLGEMCMVIGKVSYWDVAAV
jgi:hypothetical protein